MSGFKISGVQSVSRQGGARGRCYDHAVRELQRLLGKMGLAPELREGMAGNAPYSLALGDCGGSAASLPGDLGADGYRLAVSERGVVISAPSGKGVLNGVYDLAQRLGYLFLLPGDAGEWAPERPADIPAGEFIVQPRFPFRGVFFGACADDYSREEWMRFYAKLRFNTVSHDDAGDMALAEELGLRFEVGGHGLSHLLPRDLFADRPQLFRMFQPEDFNGKRTNDSNFCVTNSEARRIVKDAFKRKLREVDGAHGIHAWADDLPAGGWCLCPNCRAFSPPDQATLAMNLLAESARELGSRTRIANIAYHDTLFPGRNIAPAPECFLLFAPRERCYGHALDDPGCERNRRYLAALEAWLERFRGIGDSHTFEYYFDQVLFRGMYPFLPDIVLGDMPAYHSRGIEAHMSLQVAGPELVPEFNMLLFAEANWNPGLTAREFCRALAANMVPGGAPAWEEYLRTRGQVFTDAMRTCGHDLEIYLDYRWLPESTSPFAREMMQTYATASSRLGAAADRLAAGVGPSMPERLRKMTEVEVKRARFEAQELLVMHHQQAGVNALAAFANTGDRAHAAEGCGRLGEAIDALKTARTKAMDFGLTEKSWYAGPINTWLSGEFARKIENYKGP